MVCPETALNSNAVVMGIQCGSNAAMQLLKTIQETAQSVLPDPMELKDWTNSIVTKLSPRSWLLISAAAGTVAIACKICSILHQRWNNELEQDKEVTTLEAESLHSAPLSPEALHQLHNKIDALIEKTIHRTTEEDFPSNMSLCRAVILCKKPGLIALLPRVLPWLSQLPNRAESVVVVLSFQIMLNAYCQHLREQNREEEANAIDSLINEYTNWHPIDSLEAICTPAQETSSS